jgi:hypothetical protein
MFRKTPFTLDEAKAYIIESVKEWDVPGQTEKIISLAGMAYNRRNKTVASKAAKIKVVKKNIKSLELIVKRNNLRGLSNVELYEKEIVRLKDWCEKQEPALPPKEDKEKSK